MEDSYLELRRGHFMDQVFGAVDKVLWDVFIPYDNTCCVLAPPLMNQLLPNVHSGRHEIMGPCHMY